MSDLNELYRIGAFVGVALILIAASFLYQRFLAPVAANAVWGLLSRAVEFPSPAWRVKQDQRVSTKATSIVGLAVMCSRLLGLVRETVIAALFGASKDMDAFLTAFRAPICCAICSPKARFRRLCHGFLAADCDGGRRLRLEAGE